ncbi:MAG: GntG family PLP-dependent aldolase [bacterium]
MSHLAQPVDLRSDTVTMPSPAMRRAMAEAPVGDDVYREDPSINLLQEMVAEMLGKEAALFVPSGTMGNQLCLRTLTRTGDEVIVHEDAHVLHYEAGSAAALSGLQLRPLPGPLGMLDPGAVEQAIRPREEHLPRTGAVELENTHNRCGGTILPLEQMRLVAQVAHAHGIGVHLDGARIWNAHKAAEVSLQAYAAVADSVSVCFSKGLGAPVGSALAGSAAFVEEARVNRKRYGGAMRQAGILAAAAIYALQHNLDRLVIDHENAQVLATLLREVPGLEIIHPVQTNIIIAEVDSLGVSAAQVVAALKEQGVLCGVAAPTRVRFVTHLDVSAHEVKTAGEVATRILSSLASAGKTG